MLKALIFDVDGTLAETEEAHRAAFNKAFKNNGLPWEWSQDDYRELLRTTGGKERIARYQKDCGKEWLSVDEIAALHREKTGYYVEIIGRGQVGLRPGVRELVAEGRQKGLKIAVATTTSRPNVDQLVKAAWGKEAADVFDVIAAGDEVKAKKPAPDVFLLALERLGLEAGEAIAFEDSVPGLGSATAAGLETIVTPSIYTEHESFARASKIISDLTEFRVDDFLQAAEV